MSKNDNKYYYIGVDVGTGSVRAALVSSRGRVVRTSVQDIRTWNDEKDHYEQSSDDIWNACRTVIRNVVVAHQELNPGTEIIGIGFDATCSLVVLDGHGEPLTVSRSGQRDRNVILWMDHRASSEAELINRTGHTVLKNVGGKVSLEMEMPKLLWLKNNLPETWTKSGHFFDLSDFLTYKATGSTVRSLCALVCKWCYQSGAPEEEKSGWSEDFLKQIGLEELCHENYRKIGREVLPSKSFCGYLDEGLAKELNLPRQVAVASGMIDAHSGALGMLGCTALGMLGCIDPDIRSRLCLISGTSTCHMIVQDTPKFVSGVWGPYHSALLEHMYLSEAGQSATGYLLDFIVRNHPCYNELSKNFKSETDTGVYDHLHGVLRRLAEEQGLADACLLTRHVHVWPDYHGNRSPLADPDLKGMISGLTLTNDESNLAIVYLATIQALCYGTQHIIDALHAASIGPVKSLLICGGVSKNCLFVRTQADVCGLPVLIPEEQEAVLVGAAISAATAARMSSGGPSVDGDSGDGGGHDLFENMACRANVVQPSTDVVVNEFHRRKYKVFLEMVQDQYKYKKMMDG